MSFESNLLNLNLRGLFPGPSETFEAFFARVESLSSKEVSEYSSALVHLNKIYNAAPDWMEATVQSQGLMPWEGAVLWIEESSAQVRTCRIQLNDSFLSRLYPRDEMLAHELVHAMRLMFDEKRFEEILAYQTSKNRFRRYFGPLFSTPKETKGFIALVLLTSVSYWAEVIFNLDLVGEYILALPFFALGLGIFRLWRSQRIFSKALRKIKQLIPASLNPIVIALRLTDAEIERFAKSSSEETRHFIKEQSQRSLRWRQLNQSYFERDHRLR